MISELEKGEVGLAPMNEELKPRRIAVSSVASKVGPWNVDELEVNTEIKLDPPFYYCSRCPAMVPCRPCLWSLRICAAISNYAPSVWRAVLRVRLWYGFRLYSWSQNTDSTS